jgi:hypothetical protein
MQTKLCVPRSLGCESTIGQNYDGLWWQIKHGSLQNMQWNLQKGKVGAKIWQFIKTCKEAKIKVACPRCGVEQYFMSVYS